MSYYAADSGNLLKTFQDNLLVPLKGSGIQGAKRRFFNLDDGTDRLSWNNGK